MPAEKEEAAAAEVREPFLDSRNPAALLVRFTWLSALSIILVMGLVGFAMHWIYSSEMIRAAEQDSVAAAFALFDQEREALLVRDPDGGERIAVPPESFAGLDARLRGFLQRFHIYKVKVFSADKTIVYSTDRAIIGMADSRNANLERVLRKGEIISRLESKHTVRDLAGEERFSVDVVETYLPVRVGNSIVGSFEVYIDVTSTHERVMAMLTWSMAVLLVVLLAVSAALHLPMRRGMRQLKQAQDELRKLASVDTLTGLFNRRHVLARAREEYSRTRRVAVPGAKPMIGFIMADIDRFKNINDNYGHLAGDEVLRAVAARLKQNTRDYDVIGRYGGEEFLVALPNTDLHESRLIAERMRSDIESAPAIIEGRPLKVTMSLGVACSAPGDADESAAIARADKALYRAKNEGRNRVAWQ